MQAQEDPAALRIKLQEATRNWEQKELALRDLAEALRRGLLRVSLAADGLDEGLDQQLHALRKALRADADAAEIHRQVEEIAATLLRLDEARQRQQEIASPSLIPWLEQLARANRDERIAARIDRLRAQLPEEGVATAPQWQEALALFGEVLKALPQPKGRWWQRLLGGPGQESPEPPSSSSSPQVPERVLKTLQQLLKQLNLPAEFAPRAQALRQRLQASLDLPRLPELLEEISALVIESSREETAELELFLKHLTGRLADIQAFLQSSENQSRQSAADGEALDQAIRAQVQGIQTSLLAARDLDQLKLAVSAQLDGIIGRMGDYLQSQRRQREESEQQIADLRARLEATQQESSRLKANLSQEQHKALMDALTGIANREAYNQRLKYEVARWQRYRTPLSLVVGDIDRFKQINDSFGHSTGDKVLRTIARILAANMRETDLLARYGGEEFVILMPETRLQQATHAADKLRQAVESQPFMAGEQRVAVTLSFGVAEFQEQDSPDEVFNRADKALYEAKDAGRNKVVAARGGRGK